MLTAALIVFAIAAVGGLVLASRVLRGHLAPWAISILHALLGASGLILLILTVVQGDAPARATAALAILILAALGRFSWPRSTCAAGSRPRRWCSCMPASPWSASSPC